MGARHSLPVLQSNHVRARADHIRERRTGFLQCPSWADVKEGWRAQLLGWGTDPEVGRLTGVRRTPSLTFFADAVPENAAFIEDLLAQVAESDAEVHRAAAGATYAGEADPYKAPRVETEGEDEDEPLLDERGA